MKTFFLSYFKNINNISGLSRLQNDLCLSNYTVDTSLQSTSLDFFIFFITIEILSY